MLLCPISWVNDFIQIMRPCPFTPSVRFPSLSHNTALDFSWPVSVSFQFHHRVQISWCQSHSLTKLASPFCLFLGPCFSFKFLFMLSRAVTFLCSMFLFHHNWSYCALQPTFSFKLCHHPIGTLAVLGRCTVSGHVTKYAFRGEDWLSLKS
jgi:hypothetical protein